MLKEDERSVPSLQTRNQNIDNPNSIIPSIISTPASKPEKGVESLHSNYSCSPSDAKLTAKRETVHYDSMLDKLEYQKYLLPSPESGWNIRSSMKRNSASFPEIAASTESSVHLSAPSSVVKMLLLTQQWLTSGRMKMVALRFWLHLSSLQSVVYGEALWLRCTLRALTMTHGAAEIFRAWATESGIRMNARYFARFQALKRALTAFLKYASKKNNRKESQPFNNRKSSNNKSFDSDAVVPRNESKQPRPTSDVSAASRARSAQERAVKGSPPPQPPPSPFSTVYSSNISQARSLSRAFGSPQKVERGSLRVSRLSCANDGNQSAFDHRLSSRSTGFLSDHHKTRYTPTISARTGAPSNILKRSPIDNAHADDSNYGASILRDPTPSPSPVSFSSTAELNNRIFFGSTPLSKVRNNDTWRLGNQNQASSPITFRGAGEHRIEHRRHRAPGIDSGSRRFSQGSIMAASSHRISEAIHRNIGGAYAQSLRRRGIRRLKLCSRTGILRRLQTRVSCCFVRRRALSKTLRLWHRWLQGRLARGEMEARARVQYLRKVFRRFRDGYLKSKRTRENAEEERVEMYRATRACVRTMYMLYSPAAISFVEALKSIFLASEQVQLESHFSNVHYRRRTMGTVLQRWLRRCIFWRGKAWRTRRAVVGINLWRRRSWRRFRRLLLERIRLRCVPQLLIVGHSTGEGSSALLKRCLRWWRRRSLRPFLFFSPNEALLHAYFRSRWRFAVPGRGPWVRSMHRGCASRLHRKRVHSSLQMSRVWLAKPREVGMGHGGTRGALWTSIDSVINASNANSNASGDESLPTVSGSFDADRRRIRLSTGILLDAHTTLLRLLGKWFMRTRCRLQVKCLGRKLRQAKALNTKRSAWRHWMTCLVIERYARCRTVCRAMRRLRAHCVSRRLESSRSTLGNTHCLRRLFRSWRSKVRSTMTDRRPGHASSFRERWNNKRRFMFKAKGCCLYSLRQWAAYAKTKLTRRHRERVLITGLNTILKRNNFRYLRYRILLSLSAGHVLRQVLSKWLRRWMSSYVARRHRYHLLKSCMRRISKARRGNVLFKLLRVASLRWAKQAFMRWQAVIIDTMSISDNIRHFLCVKLLGNSFQQWRLLTNASRCRDLAVRRSVLHRLAALGQRRTESRRAILAFHFRTVRQKLHYTKYWRRRAALDKSQELRRAFHVAREQNRFRSARLRTAFLRLKRMLLSALLQGTGLVRCRLSRTNDSYTYSLVERPPTRLLPSLRGSAFRNAGSVFRASRPSTPRITVQRHNYGAAKLDSHFLSVYGETPLPDSSKHAARSPYSAMVERQSTAYQSAAYTCTNRLLRCAFLQWLQMHRCKSRVKAVLRLRNRALSGESDKNGYRVALGRNMSRFMKQVGVSRNRRKLLMSCSLKFAWKTWLKHFRFLSTLAVVDEVAARYHKFAVAAAALKRWRLSARRNAIVKRHATLAEYARNKKRTLHALNFWRCVSFPCI